MADMTPAAWLALLEKRLADRWARMRVYDAYFDGKHPMAFATSQFREAFGSLLSTFADNWCQIVVTSSARRLRVQGFRFGAQEGADQDAWAIWQANGMDAQAALVHTEAIKLGEAYWLVEPPMGGREYPRITCEHPSEFIVAHAPGDRRTRVAALKKWHDDGDGYWYATLYLPDRVWKLRSQQKTRNGVVGGGRVNWEDRPGDSGAANPLRVVPAVPVCNAPTMLGGGTSDLANGIPVQNAIDKLCMDMIVASEYAAFRQRVMTGVELPSDPAEAAKIQAGVNRLFTVEAPDAKVFDLSASDLKNYVNAIEMFIQHLAAQTNTPPHYLLGNMVNISGDALAAAESGLVSKVEDKQDPFGEAHEDAMRLAFLSMGDLERAGADDAETIWKNPERLSLAQVADAAVKKKDVGVPWAQLMQDLGYSQTQIARMQAMKMADDLLFGPIGEPAPTNVRVAETTTGGAPTQTPPAANGSSNAGQSA